MGNDRSEPTPTRGRVADVVLPLPLDQTFSYVVPDEIGEEAVVGARVLVPFGPRRLTGLVVEIHTPGDVGGLKPIRDVLDDVPSFTPEMLRLTKWMADYYACAWGEVVKAALPTGTDVSTEHRIVRTAAPPDGWASHPTARAVLAQLARQPEVTLSGLRQHVKNVPLALLRRLERDGLVRIEADDGQPKVSVRYEKHVRFAPAFQHREAARELAAQLRGSKQIAVVETLAGLALAGDREPRQSDVLAQAEATAATVQSLVGKGILEVVEKEMIRSPLGDLPADAGVPPEHDLHPAQAAALERIGAAVAEERFEAFLLHGVTGSGKTEVYIAALKQVLARGKTGIILVPEIALTPQTVQRFRAHFGDRIAVLHSRMSLGERYDAWRHLRSGRYEVVIGPRSAILAPLSNIGLIVVDEEHEASYKQFDPAPRYHARDVAVMRALQNRAVCVLGSATPSLESFANVHWGKYTLLAMPERVPVPGHHAAPLPEIRVVDLTLERKKHRLAGALSEPLREAIADRLSRREQVILLQNRRGYAPVLECEACGHTPSCHDCSVTLTYHKARRHLRCHYCGRAERVPNACPACGATELTELGAGTQRVEEELQMCFTEATVLRMDLDTTSRKNAHHELLGRFGRGEADILLGTQMVAKGLDFSRVTLVGVVNADMGMLLPDFRSTERAFQLLTQVAGRAGRAELRGEVVLQTRNPGSPVIQFARTHDYEGFARAVLPERQQLGYPPFGRMVGVEFRGPDEERVSRMAREWTARLREQAPGLQVVGPSAAFVGRVKRQYRFHTIVKAPRGPSMFELQNIVRHTNRLFGNPPNGFRIAIDVDPMGLF